MNILKFETGNMQYDISYENLEFNSKTNDFSADNVTVSCNGIQVTNFGESFAGYRYEAEDILRMAILAHINTDRTYEFINIPDNIKKIGSQLCQSFLKVKTRDVPQIYYDYCFDPLKVILITSSGAAYIGDDGQCALVNKDGRLITDIEAFFVSGVMQLVEEDEIIFMSEDAKQLVNYYSEEAV